jgi:hypothetical protein
MADSLRKRKRSTAAITIYRGDEDDEDEDEDEAPLNRDLTFSRHHGRLAQSSSGMSGHDPKPSDDVQTESPSGSQWFYDGNDEEFPNPEPASATASKAPAKDDIVSREYFFCIS